MKFFKRNFYFGREGEGKTHKGTDTAYSHDPDPSGVVTVELGQDTCLFFPEAYVELWLGRCQTQTSSFGQIGENITFWPMGFLRISPRQPPRDCPRLRQPYLWATLGSAADGHLQSR